MKKLIGILITTLLLFTQNVLPIFAKDDNWNDSIYHFNDSELLDDETFKEENSLVDDAIVSSEFDYATLIIDESHFDQMGLSAYLDAVYEKNDMGYGVNHDGIILGMDSTNEQFALRTYGRGKEIFTKEKLLEVANAIQQGYQEGYIGAQQAFRTTAYEIVVNSSISLSTSEQEYVSSYQLDPINLSKNADKDENLPSWYVSNPDTFVDYHTDINTPRLIDNADIFTNEEEILIQKEIKNIYEEEHQDIVVYTDTTSYGIDNELYSQDFYVYNGYGYGDTYDGLILFVNMDPDNREMVTSACGSSRNTFTRYNSSALDDILYDKFINQEYGQGVLDWFEGIKEVLHYGTLSLPQWYKDYIDGKENTNPKDNYLIDDLAYFSDSMKQDINNTLLSLKEKYGYDIVVYVTKKAYNISGNDDSDEQRVQQYIDAFYKAHNFNNDAIVLTILRDEFSDVCVNVSTYGLADEKVSQKVKNRLESLTLTNLGEEKYEQNINRYLSYLGKYLKNGWLPHTPFVRIVWLILCSIVGMFVGSFALTRAKNKMKTVKISDDASKEIVQNSFKLIYKQNILVDTKINKVYSPVPRSSSGPRSGGGHSSRSTYHSSSHSSSGRSFSSSRRKF